MAFKRHNNIIDSPGNSFATLNPLVVTDVDYSDGNLTHTMKEWVSSAPGWYSKSTMAIPVGKFYWECLYHPASKDNPGWGILNSANWWDNGVIGGSKNPLNDLITGSEGDIVSFWPANDNRNVYYKNGIIIEDKTGENFDLGHIGMCCVEMFADGTGKIWFGANGSWFSGGDPGSSSNEITTFSGTVFPAFDSPVGAGAVWTVNFGQDHTFAGNKTDSDGHPPTDGNPGRFYYQPPDGAKALCSANLPMPVENPQEHFKAVTYAGDSSGQTISVGMKPDLVWLKRTSNPSSHILCDTVRGAKRIIHSDLTETENHDPGYPNQLSSFHESDGFTFDGSDTWSNTDGEDYVAWCWKAGGGGGKYNIDGVPYLDFANTGLTAGDITPIGMSVNTKAGFSIVKYNAGGNVPHGLDKAPDFIITKNLDSAYNWDIYHSNVGNSGIFTSASMNSRTAFGPVNDDTFATVNALTHNGSDEYIAYCWHSVPGYSSIGSYTGNGSADGPFVYTGFKPAWVMIKNTSDSNSWMILDNQRSIHNLSHQAIRAESSGLEITNQETNFGTDLLSNGFKPKTSGATTVNSNNAPNNEYIYMAFAEHSM